MTDPSTPVTATDEERQAFKRYRGLTLSQEDYDEIRAAERARIFAALPAGLWESGAAEWKDNIDGDSVAFPQGTVNDLAAALVAAIEKELARHDHD